MRKWGSLKSIFSTLAIIIGIIVGLITICKSCLQPKTIDLTGKWEMTFIVQASTYRKYINMKTGYRMYFQQNDTKVYAKGEKWFLNGANLPYEDHVPFELEGKVVKREFKACYTLYGTQRKTVGELTLKIKDKGKYMEGTFSGTGADVKGHVYAKWLN